MSRILLSPFIIMVTLRTVLFTDAYHSYQVYMEKAYKHTRTVIIVHIFI